MAVVIDISGAYLPWEVGDIALRMQVMGLATTVFD